MKSAHLICAAVLFGVVAFVYPEIAAALTLIGFLGAVTHPVGVRNAVCNLVVDRIDAAGSAGWLTFQSSGDAAVANLRFSTTAFGDSSNGTATANTITSDTNAIGGTIAKARAFDNASPQNEVWACSVTASGGGGDITLSSVSVSAGQTVSISSLTYAAPA